MLRSIFYLDLHKARDLRPANRALIGLHSDDLRALDAETHVSARKHDCVLSCGKAHDAFPLSLVRDIGCRVINTVDIIHFKDCVVVLEIKSYCRQYFTKNFCFKNLNLRLPGDS